MTGKTIMVAFPLSDQRDNGAVDALLAALAREGHRRGQPRIRRPPRDNDHRGRTVHARVTRHTDWQPRQRDR